MTFFTDTIAAAVADFADHGYDSEARLISWIERIHQAADSELVPESVVEQELRQSLTAIYQRLVDRGEIMRSVPGVGRFMLDRVRPDLQGELQRRIMSSANLIKLNREQAIQETLQRFSGWATSIPAGGSDVVKSRQVQAQTRKEFTQLGFRERRCAIDQGHKFVANLSQILAKGSGAIAAVWHQHYSRYPRDTHKPRNGRIYLIRNSWAHERGLVKPGTVGYLDEITQPGEEVSCRCTASYIIALRRLPHDMLTERGRAEMERVGSVRSTRIG